MFLSHKLQLNIIVEWGWNYSLSRQAFTLEWQVISYTISWCDAHELLTLIQANSTRRDIDRNVFNRLAENDDKKRSNYLIYPSANAPCPKQQLHIQDGGHLMCRISRPKVASTYVVFCWYNLIVVFNGDNS